MQTIYKIGAEPFHSGGVPLGGTLLDFWRWAASDIVGNTLRGVLAEFLVARALDLPQGVRVEWDTFDLKTLGGLTLEIKSAAYLQSWDQKALSKITFGIAPTRAWNEAAGGHDAEVRRQADVYVFCLLHHQDRATVDPLDMSQWTFYVLPTVRLNARSLTQKSLSLNGLTQLNPALCAYEELGRTLAALEVSAKGALDDNHN